MAHHHELTSALPDHGPLHDMVFHRLAYPTLMLAHEFGLFQMLNDSEATIDEIGAALTLRPRAAEALVAVAAALGMLRHVEQGRYALSDSGKAYLLPSSPFFFMPLMRLPERWLENHQRDYLRNTFRQGEEPTQPWAVVIEQLPPEEIQGFIAMQHAMILPTALALAKNPVFADVRNLLDVGGGSGALSLAIAANHPHIRCTVMDLAAISRIAQLNIASYRLEDRVSTLTADMFNDPWPRGHDAMLFGNIFHDWDLDSCRKLARRAFDALEPGGQVLLHEVPLNENKDGSLFAACYSVAMLIHEKGKQYTLPEFRAILGEAGFMDFQCVPTAAHYHLIRARKPSA